MNKYGCLQQAWLNTEKPNKRMRWKWWRWPSVVQQHYTDRQYTKLLQPLRLAHTLLCCIHPILCICHLTSTPSSTPRLLHALFGRQLVRIWHKGLKPRDIGLPFGYLHILPNSWWTCTHSTSNVQSLKIYSALFFFSLKVSAFLSAYHGKNIICYIYDLLFESYHLYTLKK